MTLVRYDHTDFWEYQGDRDEMVKICTASLIGGRVVFAGPGAEGVEKLVRSLDTLKPYLAKDGYALLAELPRAFCGSYFLATRIVHVRLP